jgi:hypothetical protein
VEAEARQPSKEGGLIERAAKDGIATITLDVIIPLATLILLLYRRILH